MNRSTLALRRSRVFMLLAALVALFTAFPAVTVPTAQAATSVACQNGDFRVILPGGRTLASYNGWKIEPKDLPAGSTVQIRGRYVEFDLDAATFAVRDYTLTGAANPEDLTGGVRTPLFASKVPDLKGQTLNAGQLEIQLSPQTLLAKRKGSSARSVSACCGRG